ncbi:uncharacterized protein EAE98_004862 [Botrytis deweyae]|uniref:Uncharacterized protein n=1 Tax=Botrytis deweyae TaxID=2478750 RepID=A0ABQ7IPI6_9HELO|nr:uncharacterized protein EAE98_004862 [Botrytis deweyae]KAF7930462.1 hypothetical protein EAE98_004862 [Botrytis deweyae]
MKDENRVKNPGLFEVLFEQFKISYYFLTWEVCIDHETPKFKDPDFSPQGLCNYHRTYDSMQSHLSGKSIYTEDQYNYYSKVDSSEPQSIASNAVSILHVLTPPSSSINYLSDSKIPQKEKSNDIG